ncbi:DNA primase [Rhodopirellula sallentina]|uniref:DNA primase n=1 Tax=Rhodopirellula sallentina TaxID=1263869 RepID=UPI0005C7D4B4
MGTTFQYRNLLSDVNDVTGRSAGLSFQTDFDVKERVRNASDIVDVVGRDLELRPQGRNFVARCPFHNDTKPSMTVNPERQSWKCWVCDIGGDVFSFVMKREGLDFPGALRVLAERAGIELPQFRKGPKTQPGDPNDKPTLLAAIDAVAQAYYEQLDARKTDDAKVAWDYLASRGIDDENRQRFRIGFAPDSWDFAVNLLKRKNFSEQVAVACGVAKPRGGQNGGDGCYDFFRGRLMFPINNASGKVISLGGRIIPAIAKRIEESSGGKASAGAKYFNGPETLLYRKSSELYGLDLARDAIRSAGEVLVMEGYTDVVATRMSGIENAVAVLGTALTAHHVRILKRFAPRVVLVLDGDDAGRRRAEEVLDLFVTADADLRILTLPDNSDPADYLAEHPSSALLELAANAPDAVDHKIARLTEGVDLTRDTHRVTSAIESLLSLFVKVPQNDDRAALKIDQLLLRMSRTFELPVDRLSRRLDALRADRKQSEAKKARYQKRPAETRDPSQPKTQSNRTSGRDRFSNTPAASPAPSAPSPNDYADMGFDDPFASAAMEDAAMFGMDDSMPPMSAPSSMSAPSPMSVPSNRRINDFDSQPLTGVDRELFETLLESPEVAAMAIEAIDPDWLQSITAKMLLSAYQELDLQGHELDSDALLTLLENEFLKSQIISLQQRVDNRADRIAETPHERYAAILTRFHEREFEAEKSRQINQLESATLPEDEELAVLQAIIDAERIRHNPR